MRNKAIPPKTIPRTFWSGVRCENQFRKNSDPIPNRKPNIILVYAKKVDIDLPSAICEHFREEEF